MGSFWGSLGEPKSTARPCRPLTWSDLVFDLVIGWSQDGRQDRPKKAHQPQERPKTPPRWLRDDPRPPQKLSWNGLGAILGPTDHKIENQVAPGQVLAGSWADFGSPNGSENDPKTIPKRIKNQDEKCITFLSLLDPSWTGLEAILGPSWGRFW